MKSFWDRVHKTQSCWIWIGSIYLGYGIFKVRGKACVRPSHLYLGTQHDNVMDRESVGMNGMSLHPDRSPAKLYPGLYAGTKNGRAKINESDVRRIRSAYSEGGILQKELAAQYGLTQANVSSIIRRETWGTVC